MRKSTKYVLASGSPRRRELLKNIVEEYEVIVSDVKENTDRVNPDEIVMDLSAIKAEAVFNDCIKKKLFDSYDQGVVIGADTIVAYNGEILGKPEDEEDARNMLGLLSDRTHQVYTGVTLFVYRDGETKNYSFCESTDVTFTALDKFEINDYVSSGDPLDKAGAYGIQGSFSKHVKEIKGDYYNVVGLPVSRLYRELRDLKLV